MTDRSDMTRATDEALLSRYRRDPEGDAGKWAASTLLSRYQRQVYLWCFRYVQDHERALEMAQEVLTRAFTRLASFEGRSRFGSWLFVVARSHCLNVMERRQLLIREKEDPDGLAWEGPDPEQAFLERLDEEALLDLIAKRLDPVEQRALWLRSVERMPVDAITAVLGIASPSGARGVLQRGRRKLRTAMAERGRQNF